MTYEIVIPGRLDRQLRSFLATRASDGREAFASVLCGEHRVRGRLRLVGRHLLLPDDDCFTHRSGGGLALRPEFDDILLSMAEAEHLTPVQIHTHPTNARPHFSGIDDAAERQRGSAIARLLGLRLGSIVFDRCAVHHQARVWQAGRPRRARLTHGLPSELCRERPAGDERFDRHVQAFGAGFQGTIASLRIGVVGVGGLGSVVVEGLARLGARDFVLVDPDRVETSNLNRVVNAVALDARRGTPKTEIGRRAVFGVHEDGAEVVGFDREVTDPDVGRALAGCDVLFALTDNHASRLQVQKIGSAFHRPVISAAVGLDGADGKIRQILGRALVAAPGGPRCLYCSGSLDPQAIARESADPEHLQVLRDRGYLSDTPNPAVFWANSWTASTALGLFHDLVWPFRGGATPIRDVVIDMLTHETLTMDDSEVASDGDGCMVCGAAGLFGLGDRFFTNASASPLHRLDLAAASGVSDPIHHDVAPAAAAAPPDATGGA
jgi:hypothetical protein